MNINIYSFIIYRILMIGDKTAYFNFHNSSIKSTDKLPRLHQKSIENDTIKHTSMRFTFYSKLNKSIDSRKVNSSQDRAAKRPKFLEKAPQQKMLKKVFSRKPFRFIQQ